MAINPRIAYAVAAATAIAVPAEGLRLLRTRFKTKGLNICGSASNPGIDGFRVDVEKSAPLRHDFPFSTERHPSGVAADVGISLRRGVLNEADSFFERPPTGQSLGKKTGGNGEVGRPISKTPNFATVGDQSINSPVPLLFRSCCPSTVAFEIPGVVVYPLNTATDGRLSHVCQEVRKVSPFVAYSNSATSVVSELFGFWVRASLDDSVPCVVRPGICRSVCKANHRVHTLGSFARKLSLKASTRLRPPAQETLSTTGGAVPAVANRLPSLFVDALYRGQTTEAFASEIVSSGGNITGVRAITSTSHAECRTRKPGATFGACFGDEGHSYLHRKDARGILT